MKKGLMTVTFVLAAVLAAPRAYAGTPDAFFRSSQAFIHHFYDLYNRRDFETIYKDMTTSRFKSSEDFFHFQKSLSDLYRRFGRVLREEPNILLREEYEGPGLQFFRLEYLVSQEKGRTVQRMSLMQENNRWLIDGMAAAAKDDILFAWGNLYNFDYGKVIVARQTVWSKPAFRKAWKDTRTEHMDQNLAAKIKEFLLGANDLPGGLIHTNYHPDGSVDNGPP